jgi:hypothetical protein
MVIGAVSPGYAIGEIRRDQVKMVGLQFSDCR